MPEGLPALAYDLRLACQRISRRVRFEGSTTIAPHQFSVLVKVIDRSMSPTDLAAAERVSTPSMTRTVNCLVEQGYVTREPHPSDGRAVLVGATDAGRKVVADVMADRDDWMLRHLEPLNADQIALLREATDLLLKVASE